MAAPPTINISADHLVHLATKLLGKTAGQDAATKVTTLAGREEILRALEAKKKGITRDLAETWRQRASRTVILWAVPSLIGKDPKSCAALLGSRTEGAWKSFEQPEPEEGNPPPIWIRRLYLDDASLRATIVLPIAFSVRAWGDNDRTEGYKERDVDIDIDFTRTPQLATVFGAINDSRKALFHVLEILRGAPVPRKRAARDRVVCAVQFREPNVITTATALGFGEPFWIDADDAEGMNGTITIRGKQEGEHLQPIVPAGKVPQLQRNQPRVLIQHTYSHEHDDGFVEETRMAFYPVGAHPKIRFLARTSRDAMTAVVDELIKSMGTQ